MTTPILTLPEIAESQASKYLTHNEALRMLEAVRWGAVVKSATTAAEPPVVVDGDAYILPASPTGASWGAFAEGDIVVGVGGGWARHTPHAGVRHYVAVEDSSTWAAWDGAAWAAAGAPGTSSGGGTTGGGTGTPLGAFNDATFDVTDGTVTDNGGGSLTFDILDKTAGRNGLVAVSADLITIADGDTWELESNWRATPGTFYQEATARWLSIGFIKAPVDLPSTQYQYSNPFRTATNTAIGLYFGPTLAPQIWLDGVQSTALPNTQWLLNWDDITVARNLRFRLAPEGAADTRVLVYAEQGATPDEAVIPGWRLAGDYHVVVWASDYSATHQVLVTGLAATKL